MKCPLNTCLKDQYTLIEQSDLNTLIEQSQYSSEEQCSKLIDKEIWLVMGSYCHCQQVVTFFLNQAHAHSRPKAGCGRAPGLL